MPVTGRFAARRMHYKTDLPFYLSWVAEICATCNLFTIKYMWHAHLNSLLFLPASANHVNCKLFYFCKVWLSDPLNPLWLLLEACSHVTFPHFICNVRELLLDTCFIIGIFFISQDIRCFTKHWYLQIGLPSTKGIMGTLYFHSCHPLVCTQRAKQLSKNRVFIMLCRPLRNAL